MNITIKIIVDADSCPVKDEVVRAARLFHCEVLMVASFDHELPHHEGVHNIQVDRSDQSVDLYIANHIQSQQILITQDFGLATIALAKQAIAMSNRGQIYSDASIDFLLASRHSQAKKRRSGKHSKGPKPFTSKDRDNFLHNLTKVLKQLQENSSS